MTRWNNATALLSNAQQIILITHLSPDGDAIGSMLGLGHALIGMGKTVTMLVDDGVPGSLAFLPGSDLVKKHWKKSFQPDLVIALDCGDEARMGEMGKAARTGIKPDTPLLNIDHHWSNTKFGTENLIDSTWVSTTEAVLEWLDAMNMSITQDVAQCLLCGLVTDTLCFRTDSTKPDTLGKAQRLMESGGNLIHIVQNTVSRISTGAMKLWAQVMPTIRIEDSVIWVKVTQAARQAAGMSGGSAENKDGGLSSLLVQVDDAFIACVMHEREGNKVELSFRAIPGLDVSAVAVAIGGGGHKLAAGATVEGTLNEVEARVIPMLKDAARVGTPMTA